MPSYEDQLAAYRAQLANISSMQAQSASAVPGTGPMATAGLAFNTMMSDMSRMASYVSSFSVTPSSSSIPISPGMPTNMGMGQAISAVYGPGMPQSPMYLADYQYVANERIARGFGGTAMRFAGGAIETGAGVIGGVAGGAALGAALGTVFPGAGNVIGGIAGGILGGVAGAAATTPFVRPAVMIANASQELQLSTPAIFGGMGLSREVSRGMARDLTRQAMVRSDHWLANPAEEMNLTNMAITQGTKFGLFAGTTDTASFSKELNELTTTIKEMSRAIRMSKEEMVPLLAEMRQGGFYGAQAGGQAILQGSGLAYGAGVGFREMHEMGLRGAAMFRGTGIPTAIGYTVGEQNLYNVRRMQQLGIVSPETINQLGGVTGAAETLTAGAAGFAQGPFGRATAAMMMQGPGGVNQNVMQAIIAGKNPAEIMAQANVDPIAAMNPMNVQRMWARVGPQGMEALQAGWLSGLTKTYQEQLGVGYEDAFAISFRQYAPQMGITPNAANTQLWMSKTRELPRLMAEQRGNVVNENRRMAEDLLMREQDLPGRLGIRAMGRSARQAMLPFAEGIASSIEVGEDALRDIGDFWMGRRRVNEQAGTLTRAAEAIGPKGYKTERMGGVLSDFDYRAMKSLGMIDEAVGPNSYTFKPSGPLNIESAASVSEGSYQTYLADVNRVKEVTGFKGDANIKDPKAMDVIFANTMPDALRKSIADAAGADTTQRAATMGQLVRYNRQLGDSFKTAGITPTAAHFAAAYKQQGIDITNVEKVTEAAGTSAPTVTAKVAEEELVHRFGGKVAGEFGLQRKDLGFVRNVIREQAGFYKGALSFMTGGVVKPPLTMERAMKENPDFRDAYIGFIERKGRISPEQLRKAAEAAGVKDLDIDYLAKMREDKDWQKKTVGNAKRFHRDQSIVDETTIGFKALGEALEEFNVNADMSVSLADDPIQKLLTQYRTGKIDYRTGVKGLEEALKGPEAEKLQERYAASAETIEAIQSRGALAVMGERQTKRVGTEATSASTRQQASVVGTRRAAGTDAAVMEQIYLALKGLNEKIDTEKKGISVSW